MVSYAVVFMRKALRDVPRLKEVNLSEKAKALIQIIGENPYQNPPSYVKLVGDLGGLYSRRINIQHRLVYQVLESEHTIKILAIWKRHDFSCGD